MVGGYCLDNGIVRRELDCRGGVLVTRCAVNHLTRRRVMLKSREWEVVLAGGRHLSGARDFRIERVDIAVESGGREKLSFELSAPVAGLRLTVNYQVAPHWFFMRKSLRVDAGEHVVRMLAVESFTAPGAQFDMGGFGQPLFVNHDQFWGLEYPAGYNEIVKPAGLCLRHYPGRAGIVESKTAVWGVCPNTVNNRVRDWFLKYIDIHRPRKPRRLHTQYCVPPRSGQNLKGWHLEAAKRLFADQDLPVDALYVHSGRNIYDPQSVSRLLPESRQQPKLRLLQKHARRMLGAGLGFHINTGGGRASADHAWFRRHFDMISPSYYCLADPRVKAELQLNMLELIEKHDAKVLSFDWLWCKTAWECPHGGHRGHIRGAKYGREAITDAFIDMAGVWRRAKPSLVIEDLEVELSPWWLLHADALWSYAGEGAGTTHALVDGSLRAWRKTTVFPMNAVWYAVNPPYGWGPQPLRHPDAASWTPARRVQHEEQLKAGLNMTAGKTSPREWADNVIMGFLRGSQINEWFYFIKHLTAAERRLYAEIMHWALARQKILLANTAFVLGDPSADETYGLAHFLENNRGVIGIYNCCPWRTQTVRLALDEAAHFHRAGGAVNLEVVYPYRQRLPAMLGYGDTVELEVPGKSLVVLETHPLKKTLRRRPKCFEIASPCEIRETMVRCCRKRRMPEDKNCVEYNFDLEAVRHENTRVCVLTETPFDARIIKQPGARAAYSKGLHAAKRRMAATGKRWIPQRVMECRMAGMYAALRHVGAVGGDVCSILVNGHAAGMESGSSILNRVTRVGRHPLRYVRPYAFTRFKAEKPLTSGHVRVAVRTKFSWSKCRVWLETEKRAPAPLARPHVRGELPDDWIHQPRHVIELPGGAE